MQQYAIKQENWVVNEKAYGDIWEVERITFEDIVDLEGEFVPYKTQIIYFNEEKIDELYVKEGDEVSREEKIAKGKEQTYYSKWNGRVKEINFNEQYIMLEEVDKLLFECYVKEGEVSLIKDKMETEEGCELKLQSKFNTYTEEGIKMRFVVEGDFRCGEKMTFKAYTGTIYEEVLAVFSDCVYERDGVSYVRIVDENNNFLEEKEVKTGRKFQDNIIVSGIDEGTKCDSGYKEVSAGTGEEPADDLGLSEREEDYE